VALPLIGIASGLIGQSRRVNAAPGYAEPMTCWAALVGDSGIGKTPGIDQTRRPLSDIEFDREHDITRLRREHEEKVQRAKAARAKWKKEVDEAVKKGKPNPPMPEETEDPGEFTEPRLYVTDATVEKMAVLLKARPQGLLLVNDELAGWFNNMSRYSNGEDNQFWLTAWDGKPFTQERMARPAIKIKSLLIGVVGGLQPDRLAQAFKGPADGMYARFLFAWPEKGAYRRLPEKGSETDPRIRDMLDRLSRLEPQSPSIKLPLTEKARAEFEWLRRKVHKEIDLLDGRERDWWEDTGARPAPRGDVNLHQLGR
jgi:hypothetical protein